MAQDQQSYSRATNAAIAGLVIQVVLTLAMGVVAMYSGNLSLKAATWHLLGGLPVWIVLVMLYYQHRLERAEALEAEQLSRADARTAALFDEHGADLHLARRRLAWLQKWGLGAASIVTAVYLLTVGGLLLYRNNWLLSRVRGEGLGFARELPDLMPGGTNVALLATVCLSVGFIAFLAARYEAGMTKVREWGQLRGGASYLMGNFVVAMLLGVAMMFHLFGSRGLLAYMMVIVPAIMVALGVEILLTLLLSVYRPRRPGEIPRPAFDSRILGLLTSPKSLARAMGDAINYQFGFEVSSSWFYQLLARAVTPLFIVGLGLLLAISTIVVVQPHEQAVVTRGGEFARWQIVEGQRQPAVLHAGVHFKLPWPFETVQVYPVGRIYQVTVGSSDEGLKKDEPILWTNVHTESKEEYLLTAPTPLAGQGRRSGTPTPRPAQVEGAAAAAGPGQADEVRAPGNMLIGGQVVVQVRVRDLIQSLQSTRNPAHLLRYLAERRVNNYFARHDIDYLLNRSAMEAGTVLRQQIQEDADAYRLGLEVLFVGLNALHPPSEQDVARSFEEQSGVLQERQSRMEQAQRGAIAALASVAGSYERAQAILQAITDHEQAEARLETLREAGGAAAEIEEAQQAVNARLAEVDWLLMTANGEAAQRLADAQAYRWERAISEQAKVERFKAELAAYRAAPDVYRQRRFLEVLAEGIADARKYVVSGGADSPHAISLDLTDSGSAWDAIQRRN